jgi:hypothetical protein
MTAPAAYLVSTGRHAPHPVTSFFRRMLAALRRKPAAPEGLLVPSGAGATGLLGVRLSADMPTGEFAALDAKVDALRRPVNGVYRGKQPRRTPAHPPTVPVVLPSVPQMRAEYFRRDHPDLPGNDFGVRPQLEVLTRLRDALREWS